MTALERIFDGYSASELDRIFSKVMDPLKAPCSREGRAAWAAGCAMTSHRYPRGTAEAWWFENGWLAAREEHS